MLSSTTRFLLALVPVLLLGTACNKTEDAPAPIANPEAHSAADGHGHGEAAHPSHEVHWAYSGEGSPEKWGDIKSDFASCKIGGNQSPIDLTGDLPVKPMALAFHYSPLPLKIVNNGHTLQINNSTENYIDLEGVRYDLAQFHFHSPSEHTVNGQASALEMHMVHKNAEGKLAVVGLMMDKGADNALVSQIWSNLPAEQNKELEVAGVTLDLNSALPAEKSFVHYAGSLTTPPCSEGVKWFVLNSHATVGETQVAGFLNVIPANARPVQPANGREIVKSN